MQLHWDGNNTSLEERNLSAALGAGVTAGTRRPRSAIGRVADWLVRPVAAAQPVRGRMPPRSRAARRSTCGRLRRLPRLTRTATATSSRASISARSSRIAGLGTDPGRLNSYTEEFRAAISSRELFKGTPYQFRYFSKTDGYANLPLDGLWLRAPYLHNGSVPTLADLLEPRRERPKAFLRGARRARPRKRRLRQPRPATRRARHRQDTICFDTRLPGNGNGGHDYGTGLTDAEKRTSSPIS